MFEVFCLVVVYFIFEEEEKLTLEMLLDMFEVFCLQDAWLWPHRLPPGMNQHQTPGYSFVIVFF